MTKEKKSDDKPEETETEVDREQVLRTETQDLPVQLDDAGRERTARRLSMIPEEVAQANREFDAHKKSFAEAKAGHDTAVAQLNAEQAKMATAYRDNVEIKPVRVDIVADFQTGTICPLRTDTEEWIETRRRAMTDDERQLELIPQDSLDDDEGAAALDAALDGDPPEDKSLGVEVDPSTGDFTYNDDKDQAGDDLATPDKVDPDDSGAE